MSCEGSAKRAFGPCQSSSGPTASQPIRADPQCPCLQHRCHHSSQSLVLPFQGYSDPCPTSPATRGFALPGSHVHCHCPSGHRAPHCPAPSQFLVPNSCPRGSRAVPRRLQRARSGSSPKLPPLSALLSPCLHVADPHVEILSTLPALHEEAKL